MSTLTPTGAGAPIEPLEGPSSSSHGRGDRIFSGLSTAAGVTILIVLAGVFVFLLIEGLPGLSQPIDTYAPKTSFTSFIVPLIFGTVYAAVIALVIAVPFAIGVALFVAVYAPRRIAMPIGYLIDLLAAVPSVVYGLWGVNALAPRLVPIYDWMSQHLGWIPLFAGPPSSIGKTMLTVGIVLAIMILPIITAIMREIFAQTPLLHREAALALGATKWEMVRLAIFPYARSGMVSAVMLGLGRALGETMAVAIVLSPTITITWKLLTDTNSTTIAATIAQKFAEATPAVVHLLIAAGLVLFAITFVVNFTARAIVARAERKFR